MKSPQKQVRSNHSFKITNGLLILGLTTLVSSAADADHDSIRAAQTELRLLSLDELADLKVTSVSKKPERVSAAAAAIYVITQEDIHRSGATTLPEVLRLAPGLHVGRIDAHTWSVSARGFADQFANKLLVLIDGRSVYTPLFSGVYWDIQDTMLEDVDRIEVVRGPGGTMWGANAVNGVINVITKSARDTQGGLISGGGGTEERGVANFRYGGRLGEKAHYRVYGKYFNADDSVLASGAPADDPWWMGRGGFRTDWEPVEGSQLTLQGDVYSGRLKKTFSTFSLTPPYEPIINDLIKVDGGNVLSRFTRQFSDDANLSLQFYYDRTRRTGSLASEQRDTLDFDGQHRFRLGDRNEFIWGGGYRYSADEFAQSYNLTPGGFSQDAHLVNTFVQDEITLVPDKLRVMLGTKLEHNNFTGFEWEPSGRLSWTPHAHHTLWASVARAVRTPSLIESEGELTRQFIPPFTASPGLPTLPFPAVVLFQGSPNFRSEDLIAYELGYRVQPHPRLSLDAAVFYNVYDHLRSAESGTPSLQAATSPYVLVPVTPENNLFGETYGAELAAHWQAADWWHWQAGYTFLQMQLHKRPASRDTVLEAAEGNSPHHQFSIHSRMDLPGKVALDTGLRYVDALPSLNVSSYLVAEARIAWRPHKNVELAVVGRNLLDSQHSEFRSTILKAPGTEVQHSVYGSVLWKF
jgi:iron complex outermembrane receptor protein